MEDVYYCCLGVPVQADYDPQIGRWHVADPANQYFSPYLAMGNNPVNSIDPTGCENRGGSRIPMDGYRRMAAFHKAYQDWLNNGGKGLYSWSYGHGQTEQDPVGGSGGNGKVQFYVCDGKLISVDSCEGWMSDGFKAVYGFVPQNEFGASLIRNGGEWGTPAWEWTDDPCLTPNPFKTSISYGKYVSKAPRGHAASGGDYFAYGTKYDPTAPVNYINSKNFNQYQNQYQGVSVSFDGGDRGYYDWKTKTIHVKDNTAEYYLQHEYGHYVQNQVFGDDVFSNIYTRQSAISAFKETISFGLYTHGTYWTEVSANRWAILHFGENSSIAKFELLLYK
ncbi:MAG: hypothetical protein M0P58_05820 [Bacteroidales bacterium]|nr:hypothetical protein [Bacteroidales bacterium]